MPKSKLFEVEFAAKITVAADNQKEAAELAAIIMDSPFAFVTFIHQNQYAYPAPLDLTEYDHEISGDLVRAANGSFL